MSDQKTPVLTVICIGVALLISWGVTYYLIGVFGRRIATEMGWSLAFVTSGFTVALLTMAIVSARTGRWIDRTGGRSAMSVGAVLTALGCFALSLSRDAIPYFASWIILGVAMRLTLYDAAFAAFVKVAGPEAKTAMATVTLFGGLASTVFWPFGDWLAESIGWRAASQIYALLALGCIPLYWSLPKVGATGHPANLFRPKVIVPRRHVRLTGFLYAAFFALGHSVSSVMSAHLLGILAGAGLAASVAIWASTLRGVGQVAGRLIHITFGQNFDPLAANAVASLGVPIAFTTALLFAATPTGATAFVLIYGAAHGVATITQGTVPLALFDPHTYGAYVGRLLVPSFVLASLAPIAFGYLLETCSVTWVLAALLALSLVATLCAVLLQHCQRRFTHGE